MPLGITINGQGNSRVINVDDGTSATLEVEIHGLNITGGMAAEGGAGIRSKETLTISSSTISGNTGIGIYAETSDLQVIGSKITGNQGMGLYSVGDFNTGGGARPYFNLTVDDSLVSTNMGRGIFARYVANIDISDTEVQNNEGDGIVSSSSTAYDSAGSHNITVSDSIISGNGGAGLSSGEGRVTVERTTVANNQSNGIASGGRYFSSANISDSTISGNSGIGINSNDLTMTRSTVSHNSGLRGGGLFLGNRFGRLSRVTISESAIFDNQAETTGGGIYARWIQLELENSTISGNTAGTKGGGIYLFSNPTSEYRPSLTISNSTITGNSATESGSGLSVSTYIPGICGSDVCERIVTTTVSSSIIAGNVDNQDSSPDIDRTGALRVSTSLIGVETNDFLVNQGGNQLGTPASPIDPQLGPLQDNGGPTLTHALLEDSPAVDSGSQNSFSSDQRGLPYVRKHGPRTDMGAFEQQPDRELSTSDFDHDGNVDGNDFLIWQRNVNTPPGSQPLAGDADLDQDVDGDDLAIWEREFGKQTLTLFVPAATALGSGTLNHDIDLAHLNQDAYLDAFITTSGGPNQVWLNNGDGTYSLTNQALGTANSIYAALGDIDNDGDVDAVVADAGTEITLWENDGTGFFTASGSLPASSPIDVGLAMLDGDDRLDLFVAQNQDPDLVYLNNPINGFVDTGQRLGNASSKSVEFADLNGDTFQDAFIAHVQGSSGAPNTVWFNDGNGLFTDSGQSLGNSPTQHVALGDLDDDGDVDAFFAGVGPNSVWLNNGNGIFDPFGQALGEADSSHVALADFDLDGDLDAYVANWYNQPDRIWLNNGAGSFAASAQHLGAEISSHVALGDIDLDGDTDAVIATHSFNQVNPIWLNNQPAPIVANLAIEPTPSVNTYSSFSLALNSFEPELKGTPVQAGVTQLHETLSGIPSHDVTALISAPQRNGSTSELPNKLSSKTSQSQRTATLDEAFSILDEDTLAAQWSTLK